MDKMGSDNFIYNFKQPVLSGFNNGKRFFQTYILTKSKPPFDSGHLAKDLIT
jgi:hypothetical protein